MIKNWCKEVGLDSKRIGTHTLRKTWGYQARKKGITIEQILAFPFKYAKITQVTAKT